MDKAIYLLLGAALTWLFYFVQRRVERRGTAEAIDRHQKLLSLKLGLENANLDLEALRRFEQHLLGQAETAARIADRYFTQAEAVARRGEEVADINRQAESGVAAAESRLAAVIAHLRPQLSGGDLGAFDETHRSWLAFREHHARFIAQSYGGGAIQPLIHAVTLESLTLQWAAELETQLGEADPEEVDGEAMAQ